VSERPFERSADEPFGFGPYLAHLEGHAIERVSAAVFDALRQVPPGAVLLACNDLELFTAGLFGAWLAGRTVELPPNGNARAVAELRAEGRFATVVHDVTSEPGVVVTRTAAPSREALNDWRAARDGRIDSRTEMLVVHTSGTTAAPKRVVKDARALLGEVEALADVFARDPFRLRGPFVATVSPFQLYGLLFAVLLPMRGGYAPISETPLFEAEVLGALTAHAAGVLVTTPSHLQALRDVAFPRGLTIVTSGARLDGALQLDVAMRNGVVILDVLGSSETGGLAVRRAPGAPWTPLPGVTISTRGDDLLSVESAWTSLRDTQDRVRLLDDGRFQLLGRNDDVVKVAGKRVDLEAMRTVVRSVAGIEDVAALTVPSPGRGMRIAIAVAPASADITAVRAALAVAFDPVVVPRRIVACDVIARTDRGKIDRGALERLLGDAPPPRERHFDARPTDDPLRFLVTFPPTLAYFEGHFEGFPILPAVAPLTTLVMPLVRQVFPDLATCVRVSRARFRRPILPGHSGELRLKRKDDVISYELVAQGVVAASANLHFGVAEGS
jgi:acyl-CoA synthetase (AMP-forming)/AMP-acid ligase II